MSSPTPSLTVISNVYNDAERLPRAVASALAAWSPATAGQAEAVSAGDATGGIEVLIVDDGSTDDTGRVADSLAAADPRVRVVHRGENDGAPGAPRNLGLDEARGRWVAFVDSDDEYLPGTLRRLVDVAEAEHADVAAGAVSRYNERTERVTPLAATAYTSGPVTPLDPGSPLWHDTIAVAKVMRRDFLDEHAIRFPERILYEDQPFTVALWAQASRIATLDETVYHWYVYNVAGGESITARRHEISNFHDRLTANRAIDRILDGRPDLAGAKLGKFVEHDLALYGKDIDSRDDAYRTEWLTAARDYLEAQPEQRRTALAQPFRLAVQELVTGSDESAVAACLFAYRRLHVARPLDHREGGWWWPYVPAPSATVAHDVTRLVRNEHARGRHLRTTVCRQISADARSLTLAGTVVDGDGSLRARARMRVVLVDHDSRSVVGSAATRLDPDGGFAVTLALPRLEKDAPRSKVYDVKAVFPGRVPLPFPVRRARAVEIPVGLDLPPLAEATGLQLYRTRNGTVVLLSRPESVDPSSGAGADVSTPAAESPDAAAPLDPAESPDAAGA
ncbi:glycosyltransferase family 2 protein [Intrasporangium mesophilum]